MSEMIVYKTSNGYGNIDIMSEEWQLGRKLYEAQLYLSLIEQGTIQIDHRRGVEIARWFCELVAHVGELRADYDTLKRCLMEPDKYRFVNDGPRKVTTTEEIMGVD